jgi:hypothetical protein
MLTDQVKSALMPLLRSSGSWHALFAALLARMATGTHCTVLTGTKVQMLTQKAVVLEPLYCSLLAQDLTALY